MIICATICFCTLVLCGFIVCNGEGRQTWTFMQYGFTDVIRELSWLAVIIPIGILSAGIGLVVSSLKGTPEGEHDRS